MGQGISNLGSIIGNTITGYNQKMDENKDFQSKSKAVEALIKTHGSDFGLSKEQLDAYLSQDPNETPKGRYERLSGMVDNAVLGSKMKQMAAQQKQIEQQQAAFDRNQALGQYQNGFGVGVYSPDMQKKMQSMLQDPYASTAARLQAVTGQAPDANTITTAVEKYQNRPVVPKFDVVKYLDKDANGNPVEIARDKLTGQIVGQAPAPRQYESPEEAARRAALTADETSKVKNAQDFLDEVKTKAESARELSGSIQRVNELYSLGAQSGAGQQYFSGGMALLNRIAPGSVKGINNQQQLDKELNSIMMQRGQELMKGGGQVSNYERTLVQNASANPNLDPETNKRILGVMKNIADRSIILDNKRMELEKQGASSREIAKQLEALRASIPVGIEALSTSTNPVDAILAKYK